MSRRVLFVNTPIYLGGAEISLLTLMRSLDPVRYKPLLVTGGDGQLAEAARGYGIETLIQEFPWFRKRYPWRYPASIMRLAYTMRKNRVALVHTNCDHSLRYVMQAAYLAQVPYVSHVRDFVRTWFEPHHIIALKQAARVIANSQAVASKCVEVGLNPQRVVTIYNPIDLAQFERVPTEKRYAIHIEWDIPDTAVVVGIVGQIQPLKGHSEFVKASLKLACQELEVHFLVVGVCPSGVENQRFLSGLQRKIATSAYAGRFHFIGFREDIPSIMQMIDILTVPSWSESFGRVAVEGMAAGCAVIATTAGGLTEVISNEVDGLLIPPKDPDALLIAMTRLINEPQLRLQLANAGPRSAARFAVEKHVTSIQRLYDEVLSAV